MPRVMDYGSVLCWRSSAPNSEEKIREVAGKRACRATSGANPTEHLLRTYNAECAFGWCFKSV